MAPGIFNVLFLVKQAINFDLVEYRVSSKNIKSSDLHCISLR